MPTNTAPASRSRAVTTASPWATCARRTCDPAVVATPRWSTRSFNDTGTPCSGPRWRPAAISWSALRAAASASPAVMVMKAFSVGLSSAMRARHSSVRRSLVELTARDARGGVGNGHGLWAMGGTKVPPLPLVSAVPPLRSPLRSRPSTRIVHGGGAVGVVVPVGGAQRLGGLGQALERGHQVGQAAPQRVGPGGVKPFSNGHVFTFTETATPLPRGGCGRWVMSQPPGRNSAARRSSSGGSSGAAQS